MYKCTEVNEKLRSIPGDVVITPEICELYEQSAKSTSPARNCGDAERHPICHKMVMWYCINVGVAGLEVAFLLLQGQPQSSLLDAAVIPGACRGTGGRQMGLQGLQTGICCGNLCKR